MDSRDQEHEIYAFGWWPEIFGAAGVGLLIWYLVAFARGSL